MNQITRAAADLAEGGVLLGMGTVFFMVFFVAVVIRLFVRGEDSYRDAARLVMDDDESLTFSNHRKEGPTS